MPTWALGSRAPARRPCGFSLVELLVVLLILSLSVVLVGLNLPSSDQRAVQAEADRLMDRFEHHRRLSRTQGQDIAWQAQPGGYVFLKSDGSLLERLTWQTPGITMSSTPAGLWWLGSEPIIEPGHIELRQGDSSAALMSDGVAPLRKVTSTAHAPAAIR